MALNNNAKFSIGEIVKHRHFDVNRCMKLQGDGSVPDIPYIFEFIVWVMDALRDPNARVLVHCALAALVN